MRQPIGFIFRNQMTLAFQINGSVWIEKTFTTENQCDAFIFIKENPIFGERIFQHRPTAMDSYFWKRTRSRFIKIFVLHGFGHGVNEHWKFSIGRLADDSENSWHKLDG